MIIKKQLALNSRSAASLGNDTEPYFVLSVLSAVLSKSGKIADWNRWAISQYFRAIALKNPDFMRVCGRTRLTETDRRNHVINRWR